jgi:chromosome segregation ATPase
MKYFLRSIYRIVKLIVAGVGIIIGGGILIYGAVQALPIYAVGGGLYFVTGLLLVFDSSKILNDIKREIDRMEESINIFAQENQKLATERENFAANNIEFVTNNKELRKQLTTLAGAERTLEEENHKLQQQVRIANAQLKKLDELKRSYEEQQTRLQTLLKQYGMENEELRGTAESMAAAHHELKEQNATLDSLLQGVHEQLRRMEQAKREYEEQNTEYRALLAEHKAKLSESEEQIASMTTQIEKLRELHENSKQLIRNLVDAGDMFQQFSTTIGTDVHKLDGITGDISEATTDLNTTIARLNQQLTEREFANMDADGDGNITQQEFNEYITNSETERL